MPRSSLATGGLVGCISLAVGFSCWHRMYAISTDSTCYRQTETLKTTTPLVTKVILTWLSERYIYYRLLDQGGEEAVSEMSKPKGIGYGIGLAFALFVMQGLSTSPSSKEV